MYLPKDLLLACSTDVTREVLHHIYVDIDTRCAAATDRTVLVTLPIVPEDGDVSGFVPREAVEYAAKQRGDLRGKLLHGETTTLVAGVAFPSPFADEADPPIFVEYAHLFINHTSSVQLKVVLLTRLARTLCGSGTKQAVEMHSILGQQQLDCGPITVGKGAGCWRSFANVFFRTLLPPHP
jgi:hypothetical protein